MAHMAFYIYRDGLELKIHQGDSNSADSIYKKVGKKNFGTRPYENRTDAEKYRERWQRIMATDRDCEPPYSIDKE